MVSKSSDYHFKIVKLVKQLDNKASKGVWGLAFHVWGWKGTLNSYILSISLSYSISPALNGIFFSLLCSIETSVRVWQQQKNSAFLFPFLWDVCCDRSQVTLLCFLIFNKDTPTLEGIVFVCLQKKKISLVDKT